MLLFTAFAKLSGHMIAPKVFLYDRVNWFLISGGDDTIVKIWDLRNTIQRQSIATFKQHAGKITCIGITADSRILFTGADDGTLKVWDMHKFELLKSIKVGTPQASYPLCMGMHSNSQGYVLGFAVGLLNKKVSYYMVNYNQSNNPKNWAYEKVHTTTIDSF